MIERNGVAVDSGACRTCASSSFVVMTSDRWRAERTAFVRSACGDDAELRREVEELFVEPRLVFGFDLAPDGRFLMIKEESRATTELVLVQNWFEELKGTKP